MKVLPLNDPVARAIAAGHYLAWRAAEEAQPQPSNLSYDQWLKNTGKEQPCPAS